MLAEKNEVLRHAVDELYRVSASDEIRAQYDAREKAWRDEYARMLYAVNQATRQANAKIAELEAKNERLEAESKAQIEQLRRELARFQQN
jgi:hypothetical protein